MLDIPVLIVGGGPVGLTASLLLSKHGVRSLLVERHPGTAIVPKARGINARTMEMYRQHGVEQAIRDAGLPTERTGVIVCAVCPGGRRRRTWRTRRCATVSAPRTTSSPCCAGSPRRPDRTVFDSARSW